MDVSSARGNYNPLTNPAEYRSLNMQARPVAQRRRQPSDAVRLLLKSRNVWASGRPMQANPWMHSGGFTGVEPVVEAKVKKKLPRHHGRRPPLAWSEEPLAPWAERLRQMAETGRCGRGPG